MRKSGKAGRYFLACICLMQVSAVQADEQLIKALQQEIKALKARVDALEQQGEKSASSLRQETIEPASTGIERSATLVNNEVEQEDEIKLGGALRFNVIYRDEVDSSEGRRGEGGLDVFRLNVDGEMDNILISAEYRFYPYMNTIHHGWVGYEFADQSQLQLGIHQVPFGILPYASHNAWYGVPYYVGLADDYDMGIKYTRDDGPWNTQIAFYKNAELNDASNPDRYSYDLVTAGEQQNEEANQINARLAYTLGQSTSCETELGLSYELGQVFNTITDKRGQHRAAMVHLDSRCGRWNYQLQAGSYDYQPKNPATVSNDAVQLGAFAGTYLIDADADVLVANIAYNFAPPWQFIDSLTCYNDYSRLYKSVSNATDSQINTLGCAIGSGPLFTYVDYILARNMPFFGQGTLAAGGEDDWQGRFNINVGYYW